MQEYSIGNTQYKIPEGSPRLGIDYKLRSERSVMRKPKPFTLRCPSRRGNILAYMQWKFPEDKTLQNLGRVTTDIKWIKDYETKTNRWILFCWDRVYASEKLRRKASVKTYKIEIPHWDFNSEILEETHAKQTV